MRQYDSHLDRRAADRTVLHQDVFHMKGQRRADVPETADQISALRAAPGAYITAGLEATDHAAPIGSLFGG